MVSRSQLLAVIFGAIFGYLAFKADHGEIAGFLELTRREELAVKKGLLVLFVFCVAWFFVATVRQLLQGRK